MSQYLTVPPCPSFAMPPHAYPLGPITAHSPGRGQGRGQRLLRTKDTAEYC